MRAFFQTLLLSLLLPAGVAWAASVVWSPPTEREDGTAFSPTEVEFYELCASPEPSPPCTDSPRVFETLNTVAAVESLDLPSGTWYFTVRVKDIHGLYSDWAEPVSYQIFARPAKPVIQLQP